MLIFAIDLGQNKSVGCFFESIGGKYKTVRFDTTVKNVEKYCKKRNPDLIVIEICPMAALFSDMAERLGIEIKIADTTQSPWEWKNVKRKTDEDDALKLAKLAACGQINHVFIPKKEMREWRILIEMRMDLVDEQTRTKNRIRAEFIRNGEVLPSKGKLWTDAGIKSLAKRSKPLGDCADDDMLAGRLDIWLRMLADVEEKIDEIEAKLDKLAKSDERVRRVRTIPGVGARTAEVIVASIDDPKRFKTRRQVGAYAGLVQRRFQSGKIDRVGRITKRGRPLLRKLLNQAAWSAVQHSAYWREFYLRVGGDSKGHRKQAIVAVMRKLIVVAWAMMRDGTDFSLNAKRQKMAA